MTFRILRPAMPLILSALLLGGCYDRWTGNYDETPTLDADSAVVLEQAEISEEEQQQRLETLKQIAAEAEQAYTINGGDKIEVVVYNHPDLSVKTTITPDGYLGMVFLGQIKISGLTIAEASEKIETALSKYIRNPKVGLSPYEIVSENATISGAINHPGLYPISNGMKLADLFALAGGSASRYYDGLTVSAADLEHSIFIRHNQVIPLDFNKAITHGDPVHNIQLRRGDYVYIAARDDSMVFLIGDVKHPSRHVWTNQLGLLELLAAGGGLEETHWSNAIIIRGNLANPVMYKVDLDGILLGKKPNLALQSGDIVYIPKDNISEYNVFIRKLLPTAQLVNMILTPTAWMTAQF